MCVATTETVLPAWVILAKRPSGVGTCSLVVSRGASVPRIQYPDGRAAGQCAGEQQAGGGPVPGRNQTGSGREAIPHASEGEHTLHSSVKDLHCCESTWRACRAATAACSLARQSVAAEKALGWTLEDLAHKCDVTPHHLSAIEPARATRISRLSLPSPRPSVASRRGSYSERPTACRRPRWRLLASSTVRSTR